MRKCKNCQADLSGRHHNAVYCLACAGERERARQRREKADWYHHRGGRDQIAQKNQDPKVKAQAARRRRERYSRDPKAQEYMRDYNARPEVKARKRAAAQAAWKAEKARLENWRERMAKPASDDEWRPFVVPDYLKLSWRDS